VIGIFALVCLICSCLCYLLVFVHTGHCFFRARLYIFIGYLPESAIRRMGISQPSVPTQDETSDATAKELTGNDAGKVREKKIKKPAVKRPVARPHKRLTDEVLATRLKDVETKMRVFKSKAVLAEEKYTAYCAEKELREAPQP